MKSVNPAYRQAGTKDTKGYTKEHKGNIEKIAL